MVKDVTNRHTPINISVKKICAEIKNEQDIQTREVNKQLINNPRLMDRNAFKNLIGKIFYLINNNKFNSIIGKITHQAIDLISRKLDAVKKLAEEIAYGTESGIEPVGESCVYNCELLPQYGLPCKCWLYCCVIDFSPIPISLIHPRWFFDGPSCVFSWHMTLDHSISFEDMLCLGPKVEETQELIEEEIETEEEEEKVEARVETQRDVGEVEIESRLGGRYQRGGADLLLSMAHEALDFHKLIADAHRAEEYACDCTCVMGKLNKQ